MPQIQPGQQTPGENGAPKLYGLDKNENTIPFQERMMRLFKPQDFVTIKNINAEPVYWQYLPEGAETENFSEDGMQRIITRESPEMWVILPDETEVLVGASAFRALDVMYKNHMAATTLQRFQDPSQPQFNEKKEHMPKNFNFADGGAQTEFLEKAFLGKATPSFGPQQAAPVIAPIEQPVAAQAMQEPAPTADPTIPIPKTTEGAPTVAPTYAEPDEPAKPAKELVANGTSKK